MLRRLSPLVVLALLLTACETTDRAMTLLTGGPGQPLGLETIVAGLKEALRVGTDRATEFAGKPGAYWSSPRLRIPPPPAVKKVTDPMRRIGLGSMVDTFERKMNDGAEAAARQAAPVFVNAITQMSFADAKAILEGGDTAATDYFRDKTTAALTALYRPIVQRSLDEVGAVRTYRELLDRYHAIPLVPRVEGDLDAYVTEQALTGLFGLLAEEETRIRKDPAARTTELLRTVFGK